MLIIPDPVQPLPERIMGDALEGFEGGVSCAGVRIKDLRFADDIDLLDESEEGIIELTEILENTSRRYGMEVSSEKSKMMVAGCQKQIREAQIRITVESYTCHNKSAIGEEGNGKSPHNVPFPRKNSEPCRWFLLCLESRVLRRFFCCML